MSSNRTHEILSSVFCAPMITGTIHSEVEDLSKKTTGTVEEIRQGIINLQLLNLIFM